MSDQLPSIDDFAEDLSELPSSEEFIKEDLPSIKLNVNDFETKVDIKNLNIEETK